MRQRPGYIRLYETGELSARIAQLNAGLEDCVLCPRRCHVNRLKGSKGTCKVRSKPFVSASFPHFGEEPPLVGVCGSGTIFMSYCNLKCIYCQNHEISQGGDGREIEVEELADMMLKLQRQGCHNINFVSPTHQVPSIVEALPRAIEAGLEVPLVYNSGGYEEASTIKLLEGIFDIYMPDLKYSSEKSALELSHAHDYIRSARAALKEMHRQVGDLVTDERGIARKGLIIRHLVLPSGLAGTKGVMTFVASEISKNTYVNLMDQYRPCFRASEHPLISRRITAEEFEKAIEEARLAGITRIAGA